MTSRTLRCLALTALSASGSGSGITSSLNVIDTPSPNEAHPKPECDPTKTVVVRYAQSTGRLYVEKQDHAERGGCVMLEDIWRARGGGTLHGAKPPLYAVDPGTGAHINMVTGTWLLEEELYVEDGITLKVWGSESGGKIDELRLKSDPAVGVHPAFFINLRAHGGSLDFENTKVVGWDTVNNVPDEDETDGRSYISAVSEVLDGQTCDGKAKKNMGEARMDIVKTEMAYMGYHDSESYGLTWKVRGFCKDKSNPEIFDSVDVWGNIYDSELHHLNFAVYTYGHQGGDWRRNTLHSNSGYGFDPHDDSDFLTIHDNVVYDNTWHGIIASKRCNGVSIQNNTVYGGGEKSAGIFLHRSGDDAIVMNNHCFNNGDAGMAMLESSNATISGNTFENNKYGIRMSVGCRDNYVTNNVFTETAQYALYTYQGSDEPDVYDTGYSQNNTFDGNIINGGPQAIKMKQSDGNIIINNKFSNPGSIEWSDSTGNVVFGNTGLDGATKTRMVHPACFGSTDEANLQFGCTPSELPNSIGCFSKRVKDSVSPMIDFADDSMTLEMCMGHCEGYAYMATQQGNQCWCSSDPNVDALVGGRVTCNSVCLGDKTQICGGGRSFNIYKLEGEVISQESSASGAAAVGPDLATPAPMAMPGSAIATAGPTNMNNIDVGAGTV